MERRAGFGFTGDQAVAGLQQKVDLGTAGFAIVVQGRLMPTVGVVLVEFADHPAFEDGATQRVMPQFAGIADAEQVAGQPGIEKMQLGALDQLFADIAVPGGGQHHHETRLED